MKWTLEIEWKNFKTLFAQHFSSNAEVRRTLVDVDFNVLQDKMHCNDCTDRLGFRNKQGFDPTTTVSFKNVLCPHLHYTAGNIDLRFSIWRGMLELQHLFSDQRTDVKILWENGLLQGFMDPDEVQNNLQAVDSGLIMRLSFVMGCCVCFSVKSSNKILNLEPLDIRRLQSKSLYEYLRDIITAEEIRYVLNMNKEWLHVNDVIKMCQRVGALDSYNLTMKEIKSNAMRTGGVEVEETFCFTPMRIAVVTCKQPNVDDGKLDVSSTTFNNSVHGDMSNQQLHLQSTIIGGKSIHPEDFFERLDSLLLAYNKTKNDLIDYAYANQPRTVPINADIKKRKMSENSSPSNLSKAANLSFSIAPYERHMPNSYCLSSSSTSTMQHQEQQPQTVCYSHPSTSQQITNHQQLTMSSGISNNSIMESHNNQIIQHQSEAPSMHHYSTIYSHHLPPNDSPTVDTSIQDFDFKKQNINHYIQEPSSYHRYDKQLEMPQIHHSWPIDQQHIASFSPHQQQHHHHQPIPQSQQLNQYDKTELSVKSIHMPTIIHLPQHQQYLNSQSHQNPLNF